MKLIKSMKIGNVELMNNVFLAPMAGISDLPFRVLCKEQGAGLVCTEMVSAKGLFYGDKGTKQLLAIDKRERPIAVQIFGSDPVIMGEVAKTVSEKADILDINMGCPVPKVVKNGEGSKLLLDPVLIGKIVQNVVANSRVPVTVKIRQGWDEAQCNAVEVAKMIEENGAAAITVHGRTREQFYAGKADWEIIRQVKEAVKIPVIGNGDVASGETAKAMLEETGCDGIAIARGALGNPWIFKEVLHYLTTGETLAKPTIEELKSTIYQHIDLLVGQKGEYTAVREMRKHLAWYVKGIPHAAEIRNRVNQIEDLETLKQYVETIH